MATGTALFVMLEKAVAILGIEPGVYAMSWTAVATDPEDRSLISEAERRGLPAAQPAGTAQVSTPRYGV